MARRQSKRKRPAREDKMDKNEWPLEEGVFDRASLIVLSRFQKKGLFKTIDYCIAEGKEANVYRASTPEGGYVAVKMYRLRSPSFQHMEQYVEGDRRFEHGKKGELGIIFTWTRKEYRNLQMLEEWGIRAPKPIAFKRNVLVMEFLGVDGVPYSKLSEVGSTEPEKDYATLKGYAEKMHKNGFVHGDLSEFNVLMTHDGPCLIDVGQGVLSLHPRAEEFYERDLLNLKRYFNRYEEFEKEKEKRE